MALFTNKKNKTVAPEALDRATQLIDALIDEHTEPAVRKEIRSWFWNEVSVNAKYEALRELFDYLRPNMRPDYYEHKKFEELCDLLGLDYYPYEPIVTRHIPLRKRIIHIAAALIPILALSGAFYLWIEGAKDPVEKPLAEQVWVSATASNPEQLLLADGTEVTLNRNSELTYEEGRRCTLRGEAYFKVAKSETPFIIHTDHIDVTVLGTEFNISAYPEAEESTVTLYNGSVKLENEHLTHTLTPGKEFSFVHDSHEISVTDFDQSSSGRPGWLENTIEFEGQPLADILHSIELYYGVTIENKERINTDQRYSFRLDGNEPLSHILSVLEGVCGEFTYRIEGNRVILETIY